MHNRIGGRRANARSAVAAIVLEAALGCSPIAARADSGTMGAGTSAAGGGVPPGTGVGTSALSGTGAAPAASTAIVVPVPPPAVPADTPKAAALPQSAPSPAAAAPVDATSKATATTLTDEQKALAKKKVARAPKPKPKDEVVLIPPTPAPPPQPNFFDVLFGKSPAPADDASATGDPDTTAATAQAPDDPTLTAKKPAKGQKVAKAGSGPAAPSGTALSSGEDTPWASGELGHPVLSPGNVEPLKAAIARYTEIVAHGGWPTVPPLQMDVGTTNEAVTILRQRLAAEGDLTSKPTGFFATTETFDDGVSAAVKRFQDRYGLSPTGNLMDADKLKNGTRTVAALNVSADARLAQLKANLTRLKQQIVPKGRYVVVNIPGEQIEAVENDVVALRLNGVVGKPERPSPLLSSNIEEVKFNPIWTLPPTVVKEDLIPKGVSLQAKGVDVLAKFGIDAYDGNGKKLDTSKINWSSTHAADYRFSQQPGKDNPLGFAKLDFASPESVYMHDTPSSKLFDKSYRAASSGCIRVDHMDQLVSWLLKDTDGWTPSRVVGMKESGESQIVHLKHSVPLHWVYITAWATEDGIVHFRRDLYGKDQAFGVSQTASAY